jgi:hypothetical protein
VLRRVGHRVRLEVGDRRQVRLGHVVLLRDGVGVRLEVSLDVRVDLGVGDIVLRRVSDLVKPQSARRDDDSARR